jgi:hypothetical protein
LKSVVYIELNISHLCIEWISWLKIEIQNYFHFPMYSHSSKQCDIVLTYKKSILRDKTLKTTVDIELNS